MKCTVFMIISLLGLASCTPEFVSPKARPIVAPSEPDPPIPTQRNHVSCLSYFKEDSTLKNGIYAIDHDGDDSTEKVNVYCDMSSGGYTEILGDSSDLNLTELQKMCQVKKAFKTLYHDTVKGLGWGDRNHMECIRCELTAFKDVMVRVSNSEARGLKNATGYFVIPNGRFDDGWNVINFSDRFKNNNQGFDELYVNTVKEIHRFPARDILNHLVQAPYDSDGELEVCMGGSKRATYHKRYFRNLRIR